MPLDWLTPELVWGVFTRSIGVTYLIAFSSLYGRVTALIGERGITPIGLQLTAIRRDFPGVRRFLSFPTLLWFGHGDRALRMLLVVGMLAALAVIVGGPASFWGLVVAYLVFLSFDFAFGSFFFPWECALFEATILGFFCRPRCSCRSSLRAPHPRRPWRGPIGSCFFGSFSGLENSSSSAARSAISPI